MSADRDKDRRPSSEVMQRYGRKGSSARKDTRSGGLWRRISEGVSTKADDGPGPEEPPRAEAETVRENPAEAASATPTNEAIALDLVLPNGQSLMLVGRTPEDHPRGLLRIQIDPPPTNPAAVVSALNRIVAAQTAEGLPPPSTPHATRPSPFPPTATEQRDARTTQTGELGHEQEATEHDFGASPDTERLRPGSEAVSPQAPPPPLTWGRAHGRRASATALPEGRSERHEERSPLVRRGGAAARQSDPFGAERPSPKTAAFKSPEPSEKPPRARRRTTPLRGQRTAENRSAPETGHLGPDDSSDFTSD